MSFKTSQVSPMDLTLEMMITSICHSTTSVYHRQERSRCSRSCFFVDRQRSRKQHIALCSASLML